MVEIKNELDRSNNPYLLQHRNNPVAWRTWGDAPFEEARLRDVPVLVSIGYSTCHWCHVMAHEVFENEETAALMNEYLVCIKVDREEHPEVDEVYMEACQAMNGTGGWPLNMFVDHDRKPFFAATYVLGDKWKGLIQNVSQAWKENRNEIIRFSSKFVNTLQDDPVNDAYTNKDLKKQLFSFLLEHYDKQNPDFSGEGRAPRFPSHTLYYYLLSLQEIPGEISSKLEIVLEAIQDSGLHDRVGGGFHRYSTDREWRVPHFEKMLYDNAQLMTSFALASSRFNRLDFLQTAEHIATYLIRDMSIRENGQFIGFASAEDADDPGGEGSFYAWTPEQLKYTLGEVLGSKLSEEWNITSDNSNVHGVFPYRIPHPRGSEIFRHLSRAEKMKRRIEWRSYCDKLLKERQVRPRPFRDEKIVTETNALSLLGFSVLYGQTLKPAYLNCLHDLAKIIVSRYQGGVLQRLPGKNGHITDYGHAALSLFTAWEATGNEDYLTASMNITQTAFVRFVTPEGKIRTSDKNSGTFMPFEEKYDHAQPAGAHSLLLAWIRIRAMEKLTEFDTMVNTILDRKRKMANHIPAMVSALLQAFNEKDNGPVTITVPWHFREESHYLLKWIGTEVRLLPDHKVVDYQLCEKDKCLLPVKSTQELNLEFSWV